MKDNYILIAHEPGGEEDTHCNCCRGSTYDSELQILQYDDYEPMCVKMEDLKKQDDYFEYEFTIFHNGEQIIDEISCYQDMRKREKLTDFEYYDRDDKRTEIRDMITTCREGILKVRVDAMALEIKKEQEAEAKRKEAEAKKKAKAKEQAERVKLKELANKYPEELK